MYQPGPSQPVYYPPQQPQHRPNPIAIGCAILAGLAVVLGGCAWLVSTTSEDTKADKSGAAPAKTAKASPRRASGHGAPSATPTRTERKAAPAVVYRVGGSAARGSVTFMTNSGSIAQDNGARLPWTKTLTKVPTFMSVSGQNQGSSGTITCSIEVDGKVVDKNTSRGAYAVVSCTHSQF